MRVAGKDRFESGLRGHLPEGAPDELIQLLLDKSATSEWHVRDAAVCFRAQVFVIPDDTLSDFTLAAILADVAELGVGLDGAPRLFAWTAIVNVVYKIYGVIKKTSKLSEQERQVMVALVMGPGTPESIQRRLEAAKVFVPTHVVTATLDRFSKLGLAQPCADRHWEISTELYNTPG